MSVSGQRVLRQTLATETPRLSSVVNRGQEQDIVSTSNSYLPSLRIPRATPHNGPNKRPVGHAPLPHPVLPWCYVQQLLPFTRFNIQSQVAAAMEERMAKKRAPRACTHCRFRKVRCDVVTGGVPCTNCRLDCVTCKLAESIRTRKPYRLDSVSRSPAPGPTDIPRVRSEDFPMSLTFEGQCLAAAIRDRVRAGLTKRSRSNRHKPWCRCTRRRYPQYLHPEHCF